jgi:hypothetical protein
MTHDERKTFTIQPGYEAVRDGDGRATGEVRPCSAGSETVSIEQLRNLQQRAGIPNIPTQLTYQARLAVSHEGPRAYDWEDKPHRLVFDLCREIERLHALAQPVGMPPYPTEAADKKLATDWYTWGFQAGMEAERKTVARSSADKATPVPTDALIKLANHWRNCDEDNDLVKVSRLALAEVLAYVQMVRPDLNGGQQGATKPVVLEPLPTDRYAVDDPWHRPPPINEPQGSSNPEGGK